MSDLLNPRVQAAMNVLADAFVFRKLGICYDLRAGDGDFPSKLLPTAKEVTQSKPDARGRRTGMSEAALNNALLFDGYALRLEIGFAEPDEDRIFDRLIGGAIRLAIIAPKSALVGGLAPDGKSFYPAPGADNYIAWAFYAWRVATSSTVSPESQGKLRNIASRWIARLEADKFVLPGQDNALNEKDWSHQPLLPGVLAAAWALTGEEKWKKLALETADFSAALPPEAGAREILTTQLALHLFTRIFATAEGEEAIPCVEAARERMLALLPLAASHLDKYKGFKPAVIPPAQVRLTAPEASAQTANAEAGKPAAPGKGDKADKGEKADGAEGAENAKVAKLPVADWRAIPAAGDAPEGWQAVFQEETTLVPAAEAAMACLLLGQKEALESYVPQLTGLIRETPWEGARLAASLCPVVAVHARGVELALWDAPLGDYHFEFDVTKTLVERFMSPEFDEQNPQLAGHADSPEKPKQNEEEGGEKTGKRRRRRRKRK